MLTPALLGIGGSLLRFYQRSGAQRMARGSGLLRRIGLGRAEGFLPPLPNAVGFRAF
jgi:hypothetical protein